MSDGDAALKALVALPINIATELIAMVGPCGDQSGGDDEVSVSALDEEIMPLIPPQIDDSDSLVMNMKVNEFWDDGYGVDTARGLRKVSEPWRSAFKLASFSSDAMPDFRNYPSATKKITAVKDRSSDFSIDEASNAIGTGACDSNVRSNLGDGNILSALLSNTLSKNNSSFAKAREILDSDFSVMFKIAALVLAPAIVATCHGPCEPTFMSCKPGYENGQPCRSSNSKESHRDEPPQTRSRATSGVQKNDSDSDTELKQVQNQKSYTEAKDCRSSRCESYTASVHLDHSRPFSNNKEGGGSSNISKVSARERGTAFHEVYATSRAIARYMINKLDGSKTSIKGLLFANFVANKCYESESEHHDDSERHTGTTVTGSLEFTNNLWQDNDHGTENSRNSTKSRKCMLHSVSPSTVITLVVAQAMADELAVQLFFLRNTVESKDQNTLEFVSERIESIYAVFAAVEILLLALTQAEGSNLVWLMHLDASHDTPIKFTDTMLRSWKTLNMDFTERTNSANVASGATSSISSSGLITSIIEIMRSIPHEALVFRFASLYAQHLCRIILLSVSFNFGSQDCLFSQFYFIRGIMMENRGIVHIPK